MKAKLETTEVIDLVIKTTNGSHYWGYAIWNGKSWHWDRKGEEVWTKTFNALILSLRKRQNVIDVLLQPAS